MEDDEIQFERSPRAVGKVWKSGEQVVMRIA